MQCYLTQPLLVLDFCYVAKMAIETPQAFHTQICQNESQEHFHNLKPFMYSFSSLFLFLLSVTNAWSSFHTQAVSVSLRQGFLGEEGVERQAWESRAIWWLWGVVVGSSPLNNQHCCWRYTQLRLKGSIRLFYPLKLSSCPVLDLLWVLKMT